MSSIYKKVNELLERQGTFALATIVDYKGSVPRQLAKMIVTKRTQDIRDEWRRMR